MAISQFHPVKTFSLPRLSSPLGFDLYLRLGLEKYAKVFSRGSLLEPERLHSCILKGTKTFYVHNDDHIQFMVESQNILEQFRKEGLLAQEDAYNILDEVSENILHEIFQKLNLDIKIQPAITSVANSYVDIATKEPRVLSEILKLAKSKRSLFRHLIMTSVFSTLIAKGHSPNDRELMFTCACSGFLHDIGLGLEERELSEHSYSLDPVDVQKVRQHPNSGVDFLKNIKSLSESVLQGILQHHEGYDGGGYPKGLEKEQTSLVARIVRVADEFVSLTTGGGNSVPLPPQVALHTLGLNRQIDPNILSLLTKLLSAK